MLSGNLSQVDSTKSHISFDKTDLIGINRRFLFPNFYLGPLLTVRPMKRRLQNTNVSTFLGNTSKLAMKRLKITKNKVFFVSSVKKHYFYSPSMVHDSSLI